MCVCSKSIGEKKLERRRDEAIAFPSLLTTFLMYVCCHFQLLGTLENNITPQQNPRLCRLNGIMIFKGSGECRPYKPEVAFIIIFYMINMFFNALHHFLIMNFDKSRT